MYKPMDIKEVPQPIFLYGSGRSGTTWLVERIAEAVNADVIFEPLHPEVGSTAKDYAYRYLAPGAAAEPLLAYFRSLLSGEFQSLWTRYRILRSRLIPSLSTFTVKAEFKVWLMRLSVILTKLRRYYPNRRLPKKLIKLIRANMLLPWLVKALPDARHIVIVRHPASVIESRMRLDRQAQEAGIITGADDWSALKLIWKYLENDNLPENIIAIIAELPPLETLSEFEKQCILWCLENKLVLGGRQQPAHIIYYEQLLESNSSAWQSLAAELGVEVSRLTHNMYRPSQQASQNNKTENSNWHISGFENLAKFAGVDCLSRLQFYLDVFMIKDYVANQLAPNAHPTREGGNGA